MAIRIDPKQIQNGMSHLRRRDRVMKRLIDQVGPFRLRLTRDRFAALARSIVSQQISTAAARSIWGRLERLLEPDGLSPTGLLELGKSELRGAGVSPQKQAYLRSLAEHAHEGRICLRSVSRRSDEAVIAELTQVKGIGRWTAQMFLIFSLGRLDVFPEDDLGVRSAIRNRYGLSDLPDKQQARAIAAPWRPYASLASWYCWRSLELDRAE